VGEYTHTHTFFFTRCEIPEEKEPEADLSRRAAEHLLEFILEREVERLRKKINQTISLSLFLDNKFHA
jgi:hypothetical protein